MSPDNLQPYLPFLFAINLVVLLVGVLASILYRHSRGKPVWFWDVPHATFIDKAASGRSNRTWYSRLGGARRCLVVAIASGRLIIRPRFPFNMLFLPEIYGLEYDVPLGRIVNVEVRPRRADEVRLEFRDAIGTNHDVTLQLRDRDRFMEALRAGAHTGRPH